MATGVKDLRIYQIGKETVHGTAVPATTRLVGDLEITPDEAVKMPAPQLGVMIENPTTDSVIKRMGKAHLTGELTYEQILHLLEMSIDGGITPTGAGADKTWVYNAVVTADPLLSSFSLQRRLTDGTTNWDEGLAYAMCSDFKLSGALADLAKFEANIFGRPIDRTVALTAAIAVPSVNFVAVPDFKLFIDDTFAGLGATQITEALVSWDIAVRTQVQPKFFQDGRADRSFTNYGLKRLGFDFSAQVEMNAAINGERAKAASRAIRYCRLVATGAALGASNYKVQIDFAARYKEGMFDGKGDHEGNDIMPLDLVSAWDATNLLGLKFTVVNALTALP